MGYSNRYKRHKGKPVKQLAATMAIWAGMGLLLSACSHPNSLPTSNSDDGIDASKKVATSQSSTNSDIWPSLNYSRIQDTKIEHKIAEILSSMTLEQKIAQMIQPEIRDFTVEDMRKYGFGSFLNGGGAFPNNNKHAPPQDWITLAENMYQASVDDSLDGSTIPAIWGTDAVHGHNNVIGATLFPHNIGLGAANNPSLIEKIAEATAREVMATGIDWVFAPTVAVVRNDRWGRTYEGYSEDPDIVKSYSEAIVKGLQGPVDGDFLSDRRVISTVKHFLGDGGTQNGVDQGNNIDDEQALFNVHAQGYVGGLTAGAQTVMASFNSWNGQKMHGHHYLLTEILKGKMGFDGFVVGDWLGHGQIPGCTNENCSKTINAGLDVFMASGDSWKPLMKNTIAQVKNGEIPESRINDAVSRILRVKLRAGVFEKPSPANRPLSGKLDIIGSKEHRDIARQAVRESLVLLKNKGDVLPIDPSKRILVAGDAADNIGKQSGGWTITWQGTNNANDDFPGGTSIFDGLKQAINSAGGKIELSEDGSYKTRPDVAIVVFGEEPYAEGVGDVKNLAYQHSNKTDLAILKKLKSAGIPVVSVFISGRPLYVNAEINASDAFVAAWLPGSEGIGVSDVILSNPASTIKHDFTGRLSYSWPASATQSQVNRYDEDYAPLLPYGYGLSYSSKPHEDWPTLNQPLNVEQLKESEESNIVIFKKLVGPNFSAIAKDKNNSTEMTSNVLAIDGMTVRTIDKTVQEDARQITFESKQDAAFAFNSGSILDLTNQRKAKQSLFLNIRLDSDIVAPVTVGMECGVDCSGTIDLSNDLQKLAKHEWQELNISLACFEKHGVQLDRVTSPFVLRSNNAMQLSISEISFRNTPNVDECHSSISP